MESNQVTPVEDDDFYPMNDEETSDHDVEDDTGPSSQNLEGVPVPAPDINVNMDLFRYQENLFQKLASKKSMPSDYELDTELYFGYHFDRFSKKLQERIDDSETAFNIYYSLQEFVKVFKDCKTEDKEIRAADLTRYLAQMKEDLDQDYQQPSNKRLKPAEIDKYNEIIKFLDSALFWRIKHDAADFPDIREKDIAQELLEIEGNIKLQYGFLVKPADQKNKEDVQQELENILQRLERMKICQIWDQKACKRLELRQEVNRLLDKMKKGKRFREIPREKHTGELPGQIFEEINHIKSQILEEKERTMKDQTADKVSDSFDIPSAFTLKGTFLAQSLKERASELDTFSLEYGDIQVLKALRQIIEVVNLVLNSPCGCSFLVYYFEDLIALLKDQQVEIQNCVENDELGLEILVFVVRLVDILEDTYIRYYRLKPTRL